MAQSVYSWSIIWDDKGKEIRREGFCSDACEQEYETKHSVEFNGHEDEFCIGDIEECDNCQG